MRYSSNKGTIIGCIAIGLALVMMLGFLGYLSSGFKEWDWVSKQCDCGVKAVCDCECKDGKCDCVCDTCNPITPTPTEGELLVWFYNVRDWRQIGIYSWGDALLGDKYIMEENKLKHHEGDWYYFQFSTGDATVTNLMLFNWHDADGDRVEAKIKFADYEGNQVFIDGADGSQYATKAAVPTE